MKAHQGIYYVVIPAGERLVTVGKEDGLIKIWHDITADPTCQMEVPWPRGFVAGWALEPDGQSVLLIDEEGAAGVFDLTEASVQLACQLQGDSFRAVVGQSPDELARCRRASNEAKACELIAQATELIGRGRPERLDGLAAELGSLGFTKASLGIRAQGARLRNDPLEELEIRNQLAHMLDGDYTACKDSMRRYAFLLEQLWQLPRAWLVYRELGADINDYGRYKWLERAARILTSEPHTIEPDVPLSDAVRAATVLDTAFSGAWVLACSKTMTMPPEVLSVEGFLGKYEQLRQEPGHEAAPAATCQTVWWISRNDLKETILINFGTESAVSNARIESALRFDRSGTVSTLTPVLLLKADGPTQSVQLHNQELLHMLGQTERDGFTSAEQWDLQRLVTLVVRRLWTESAWRRQGGKDVAREQI